MAYNGYPNHGIVGLPCYYCLSHRDSNPISEKMSSAYFNRAGQQPNEFSESEAMPNSNFVRRHQGPRPGQQRNRRGEYPAMRRVGDGPDMRQQPRLDPRYHPNDPRQQRHLERYQHRQQLRQQHPHAPRYANPMLHHPQSPPQMQYANPLLPLQRVRQSQMQQMRSSTQPSTVQIHRITSSVASTPAMYFQHLPRVGPASYVPTHDPSFDYPIPEVTRLDNAWEAWTPSQAAYIERNRRMCRPATDSSAGTGYMPDLEFRDQAVLEESEWDLSNPFDVSELEQLGELQAIVDFNNEQANGQAAEQTGDTAHAGDDNDDEREQEGEIVEPSAEEMTELFRNGEIDWEAELAALGADDSV